MLTATAIATFVVAVNISDGGYFERSWGWIAAVLLWLTATALVTIVRPAVAPFPLAFVLATSAFVAWVGLSALWSESPPRAIREVERDVVYLAFASSVAVLGSRLGAGAITAGTFAGGLSISLYALAMRVFPEHLGTYDPFAEYRLSEPVGYWNALGLLIAMTLLLGVGIVARAQASTALRCLVAGALVPAAAALYFTFSRGAWVALLVGVAAMLVLDPHRLGSLAWLAGLALMPAAGVLVAAQQDALTVARAPLAAASREGQRLVLVLLALAVLQAGIAVAALWLAERMHLSPALEKRLTMALALVAAGAAVVMLVLLGGPQSALDKLRDRFAAPAVTSRDLNERLFSLSGNNRSTVWGVAWSMSAADPIAGAGGGMFEVEWLRERPFDLDLRDAHGLYIETLAELGTVGLALLVIMLGVPLAAAYRARRHPFAPAACGAYTAFVVHAAFDWDWEVVGVTLVALLCAAVLLVAAPARSRVLRGEHRVVAVALVLGLSVFAMASRVGNEALERARQQLLDGRAERALRNGRLADRVLPWSVEPLGVIGSAQKQLGATAAGRHTLRRAVARDPSDWSAWYRLAHASEGVERATALAEARRLNPREAFLADPP